MRRYLFPQIGFAQLALAATGWRMRYLPFFPDYAVQVTALLESCRDGNSVVYFFKGLPVFTHHVGDVNTFHMITAQFCVQGHAREEDIVRAYRVPVEGVELAVDLYRDMGADGFYPDSVRGAGTAQAPKGKKPARSKAVKAR